MGSQQVGHRETEQPLAYQQLQERIARIPQHIFYLAIAGVALAFSHAPYHPRAVLELWLALLILQLIYRFVVWIGFRWYGKPRRYRLWDLLSFLGSFANVVLWAFAVPLFNRADEPATIYLNGLFIIAIATGGILSVKTDSRLVVIYPLFLLGSLDLWLWLHGPDYYVLATLVLLFLSFITLAGMRLHREYQQSVLQAERMEHLLQEQKQRESYLRKLLDRLPVGVMHYDRQFRITSCNPAYTRLFQCEEEDLVGLNVLQLKDQRPVEVFRQAGEGQEGVFEGEYCPTTGPVERMYVRTRVVPLQDEQERFIGAVCTVEDLTDERKKEQQIRNMAYYDPLTGLPNRKLLFERLTQLLALYRRHPQQGALLYLDLDNFKNINDQYGHSVGDALLVEVVRRIRSRLREEDTLARMGGDEFVILLPDSGNERLDNFIQQVNRVSDRIHAALTRPIRIQHYELQTGASIGVVGLDPEVDAQELLRRADLAMYRAKALGRGRTQIYEEQLDREAQERRRLEQDLRHALGRNELELYYQPIVNAAGQCVGAEGLLRWIHPELGFISPERFIAVAEDTGLIGELGRWVLEAGIEQLSLWQRDAGIGLQYLSLNVSPRELEEPGYVAHLAELLARYRIRPGVLKLELTESVHLKPDSTAARSLRYISELGVDLLMDDFGTGYSSLEYLTLYPFSGLKVDRLFVDKLLDSLNGHMLVAAMVAIARQFGMRVIAEGVETLETLDTLVSMESNIHYQGYLCSPPLPVEEFEQRLLEGGMPASRLLR